MEKRTLVERQILNLVYDEDKKAIYVEHPSGYTIDITSPATPTVYNVTLTILDTEYSQALPADCRFFEFQCQTAFDIRFAFVTGKVATPTAPYMTLKSGCYYYSPTINQASSPSTLYFATDEAGVVVEIIAWT